jgi:YD repeat-containing protein
MVLFTPMVRTAVQRAGAANVNVDAKRTSSTEYFIRKIQNDIETLQDSYADALLGCRPVWYRSTCENDNPSWGWWGFIAEEVAAIDPRLVQWKTVEVTYDENGSAVEHTLRSRDRRRCLRPLRASPAEPDQAPAAGNRRSSG